MESDKLNQTSSFQRLPTLTQKDSERITSLEIPDHVHSSDSSETTASKPYVLSFFKDVDRSKCIENIYLNSEHKEAVLEEAIRNFETIAEISQRDRKRKEFSIETLLQRFKQCETFVELLKCSGFRQELDKLSFDPSHPYAIKELQQTLKELKQRKNVTNDGRDRYTRTNALRPQHLYGDHSSVDSDSDDTQAVQPKEEKTPMPGPVIEEKVAPNCDLFSDNINECDRIYNEINEESEDINTQEIEDTANQAQQELDKQIQQNNINSYSIHFNVENSKLNADTPEFNPHKPKQYRVYNKFYQKFDPTLGAVPEINSVISIPNKCELLMDSLLCGMIRKGITDLQLPFIANDVIDCVKSNARYTSDKWYESISVFRQQIRARLGYKARHIDALFMNIRCQIGNVQLQITCIQQQQMLATSQGLNAVLQAQRAQSVYCNPISNGQTSFVQPMVTPNIVCNPIQNAEMDINAVINAPEFYPSNDEKYISELCADVVADTDNAHRPNKPPLCLKRSMNNGAIQTKSVQSKTVSCKRRERRGKRAIASQTNSAAQFTMPQKPNTKDMKLSDEIPRNLNKKRQAMEMSDNVKESKNRKSKNVRNERKANKTAVNKNKMSDGKRIRNKNKKVTNRIEQCVRSKSVPNRGNTHSKHRSAKTQNRTVGTYSYAKRSTHKSTNELSKDRGQKQSKTRVNNKVFLIVRGVPGSGAKQWAQTISSRAQRNVTVLCSENNYNYRSKVFRCIQLAQTMDCMIILIDYNPQILYEQFITAARLKGFQCRIIEILCHPSLICMYQCRSDYNISQSEYEFLLGHWQTDPRADLIYNSQNDKSVIIYS